MRPSRLAIDYFEITEVEDFQIGQLSGRLITISWSASGVSARVVSGAWQRLQDWWVVPISVTFTLELTETLYRDPTFTLEVFDRKISAMSSANKVAATDQLAWDCAMAYFFAPPERCPLDVPSVALAACQQYEEGEMVWLESEDVILVLHGDGTWARFPDTWAGSDPAGNPSIELPPRLLVTRRGFGKVWRENADVRERLGWALAPESDYQARLQNEHYEGSSSGAPRYLELPGGRVISVFSFWVSQGTWQEWPTNP